jgi:arylsulfatase A-like enzyme
MTATMPCASAEGSKGHTGRLEGSLGGVASLAARPRRSFLGPWLIAALLLGGCRAGERPGVPPRDVLLITVDTLRADHLSAWLYPRSTSRSTASDAERAAGRAFGIDELTMSGVQFANAFTYRSQTFPSMVTLMTGRTPFGHGAIDNVDRFTSDAVTLAELLASEGFTCGAFTTNRLLGPGLGPDGRQGPPSGIERGFGTFVQDFDPAGDRDLRAIQAAANWVRERRAGGDPPLFTWIHLMGPHLPYDPQPLHGTDFATLFTDPGYGGEANGGREFLDGAYAEGRALSGEDVNHVVSLYDGEIARVSRLIELFCMVYDDLGEGRGSGLDRTLLVFAGDHGEELYQRNGYWAHSKSVYGSGLHVPLVFRHPPSLTGRRVIGELVGLDDVLPTLCDWLELPTPPEMEGRSLLPLVDSYVERPFASRPAFGHWRDAVFTVRTDDWRLVWNPERVEPDDPPAGAYPVPELALYDVRRDPLELHDVAPDHSQAVGELLDLLRDWIAERELPSGARTVADPARWAALVELGYAVEAPPQDAPEDSEAAQPTPGLDAETEGAGG